MQIKRLLKAAAASSHLAVAFKCGTTGTPDGFIEAIHALGNMTSANHSVNNFTTLNVLTDSSGMRQVDTYWHLLLEWVPGTRHSVPRYRGELDVSICRWWPFTLLYLSIPYILWQLDLRQQQLTCFTGDDHCEPDGHRQ
jgi:hypothetical protein